MERASARNSVGSSQDLDCDSIPHCVFATIRVHPAVMKVVVQRVRQAQVRVAAETVAGIGPGVLIFIGVAQKDTPKDAEYLAAKVSKLRIFDDADGKLNDDIRTAGGDFLVVSQYTLCGDCRKGNRPSYVEAAAPDEGRIGYQWFVDALRGHGHLVKTGQYQKNMEVELINDGPVTLLLESRGRDSDR